MSTEGCDCYCTLFPAYQSAVEALRAERARAEAAEKERDQLRADVEHSMLPWQERGIYATLERAEPAMRDELLTAWQDRDEYKARLAAAEAQVAEYVAGVRARHRLASWHSEALDADIVTCAVCSTPEDDFPCPDLVAAVALAAGPLQPHPLNEEPVKAMQWNHLGTPSGDNGADAIVAWIRTGGGGAEFVALPSRIVIWGPHGDVYVKPGQWVVKGDKGFAAKDRPAKRSDGWYEPAMLRQFTVSDTEPEQGGENR